MNPEPTILIPALDEANNIREVIRTVKDTISADIIVIDDASTDATAAIAREEGARVLPLTLRLGAWGAVRTGIRYANARGFDMVVTMDADGQHPPAAIHELIAPIIARQADVVVGSCTERGSAARKLSWLVFRKLTGLDILDLTSGFRAYNAAAISALMTADTALLDYQDIGVLLALTRAGMRVIEVPVKMCPRTNGHSRVFSTWWDVLRYLLITGILCLSKWNLPVAREVDS